MIHYILKRRSVQAAAYNSFHPMGQVSYGKWVRLARSTTWEDAAANHETLKGGLYDWAIFYGGKRVSETISGRLIKVDQ